MVDLASFSMPCWQSGLYCPDTPGADMLERSRMRHTLNQMYLFKVLLLILRRMRDRGAELLMQHTGSSAGCTPHKLQ
jgi:hypothetical protein